VVGNWIKEIKMWCPAIRAIRMGGTKDERLKFEQEHLPVDPATGKHKWDVLITSYEGLLKGKGKLNKIPWSYLIIDEAHRIKNENSSLSKAVRIMNTDHRLLITGTPLQNNLRELWALLNFLMPDVFGDAEQFDAWFSLTDESGKENVIKKLHTAQEGNQALHWSHEDAARVVCQGVDEGFSRTQQVGRTRKSSTIEHSHAAT
jgi:SWI/SNF-related matrix-associated actin-dependent regulator of chromatin subfamily A member 5